MSPSQLIPLGAGLAAAVLHLSVPLVSPAFMFASFFVQLPLAATGLALGLTQAAVASSIAAVVVALAAPGVGALSVFILTMALPVLVVVHFALQNRTADDGSVEWYPVGRILGWLTALALAAFGITVAAFALSGSSLDAAVRDSLGAMLGAYRDSANAAAIDGMVGTMARFFPSMAATSWLLMIVINCVLAQRFLTSSGKNLRPSPAFHDTDIPSWPLAVAVPGAVLAVFGGNIGFLGINAMLIALIPFFFIGLAVLHSISAAWPGRPLLLAGVYLLLILLLWPAAIVAVLGIAEKWLGLRTRAKAQRTNKGND